ncbi:unnamed protein product [Closterium sp. NIES-53]
MLESSASRCFFRDSTTLTPLLAPVPVRLAGPSGGPVLARSSTVLPCPAVPSGSLSGLHLPSFSTNLVSTAALQDAMVTTTTPGGQRVSICTCTRTGHHLATFTLRPGLSLYTLAIEPPQVAASAQVSASGLVAPPCSCRLLSHQTLLWHHRLGHPSLPRLRGMHSRLLRAAPHSSSFPPTSALLQTLHMDVWGPARVKGQGCDRYFLLVVDYYTRYTTAFPLRSKGLCHGEGMLQSFTLPASPQQNGIAESRIGLVMEVALTSMIHAAAPHSSGPVSPCRRPRLHCVGRGRLAMSRCSGSGALVPLFFYHPTSCRVLPSQDVTFDESVPFYRLFPYRSTPLPPPPLFLAPGAARGVASGGATSGGAASGGVEPAIAEPGGAEPVGAEPEGAESEGAGSWGAEHGGLESEGAESEGAELGGTPSAGSPTGASPRLSPRPEPLSLQQLREWFAQCTCLRSGAAGAGGSAAGGTGAGGAGATSLGGAGVLAGAGGTGGTGAAGAGDVGGAGAGGAGAGDPGAGGAGAGGTGAGDYGTGGGVARGTGAGGAGARGAGAVDPGAGGACAGGAASGGTDAGGTVQRRPIFVTPPPSSLPPPDSVLHQVLSPPSSRGLPPSLLSPPPRQLQPQLQPNSPLPAPSPYVEQTDSITERRQPESRPASPVRAVCTGRRVPRPRPPPIPGTHVMALRPSFDPLRVPLPPPPESSLLAVPDPESYLARAASPTVSCLLATVVTDPSFESTAAPALVAELVDFAAACRLDYATSLKDFECLAAAVPHLVAMLLALEGDPDAPDIPTPRPYAEAITGPYSSQWQTPMDAEMASWKSTGTYRKGVDFFQNFSPTPKMTTLRVLLHVAAQRDYELHSLEFSTAFLQGSLHEEIWLRRPPGFSGSFPAGTQWSLRRPVYGLRQAPREWHDTLTMTLVALGFAPSSADPSLFLRTDTSLPPFYVLMYVNDLVFATADIEALALVKSELQKRHTCTNLGELRSYLGLQITRDRAQRTITLTQSHMVQQVLQRFGFRYSSPQSIPQPTGHSLSAPPSDESVEPSGPYPELVGCLITSGKGLVLGGRGPVLLTRHVDASWVDDLATQWSSQGYTYSLGSGSVSWRSTRSSSELRWLTYLLADLGEQPRSTPVLCVDNKAMIALCQEHRTKHIVLRYFLSRELQQRGQRCLAYVATRANTADIFTKALQSACFGFLEWSCDHLFSPTLPMGVCQNCSSAYLV